MHVLSQGFGRHARSIDDLSSEELCLVFQHDDVPVSLVELDLDGGGIRSNVRLLTGVEISILHGGNVGLFSVSPILCLNMLIFFGKDVETNFLMLENNLKIHSLPARKPSTEPSARYVCTLVHSV
eukprot:gene24273-biopygen9937